MTVGNTCIHCTLMINWLILAITGSKQNEQPKVLSNMSFQIQHTNRFIKYKNAFAIDY